MLHFRLAAATRYFKQPLLESIKDAASMKVEGIQFDLRHELRASELSETGRRDLMHRISEFSLKLASSAFGLNHPLYESSMLDSRIEAIRRAMTFAYSMKSKTLCVQIGQIPLGDDSKERKLLIESLNDLARHASHVGTVLAIAPANESAEELKSLLDEIKTGPIGVDFDPAHFAMTGQSVSESLKTLYKYILHVQLRDGIRGINRGQESVVGRGNVDWIEVFALLSEIDYRGWLTAIRTEGDDRMAEISRGIKFARKLMRGG